MYTQYLDRLTLWSEKAEVDFIVHQQATCYNGIYPFKVFLNKDLQKVELAPITIFYGSNGSGKTTLLNIIAEKARVTRHSSFSGGAFFDEYVHGCRLSGRSVPENSEILTSDDVFDYLLDVRGLNDGLDVRREELIQEYFSRKRKVISNSLSEHPVPVHALRDYEEWKEDCAAANKKGSVSQFVNDRMMKNVDMYSNGESAMRFFVDHITEGALYLLDEPENSLSISLQQDLCEYITASARHFGCQFIIATHSPVLLSMENALIYDLDAFPIKTKPWTQLENVRKYFEFFEGHRAEFLSDETGAARETNYRRRLKEKAMNGFLTVVVSKNDTGLPYDLLLYSLGKRSGHSEPRLVVDIGSERVPVSISSAPEILADKAIEDFFAVRDYICRHLPLLLLHWNNDCTDKEVLMQLCEKDKE